MGFELKSYTLEVPVVSQSLSDFPAAKECSVTPPMLHAATPVLPHTTVPLEGSNSINVRNRYDFPVPAPPVKKTLLPALIAVIMVRCSALRFKLPAMVVRSSNNSLLIFFAGPSPRISRSAFEWVSRKHRG